MKPSEINYKSVYDKNSFNYFANLQKHELSKANYDNRRKYTRRYKKLLDVLDFSTAEKALESLQISQTLYSDVLKAILGAKFGISITPDTINNNNISYSIDKNYIDVRVVPFINNFNINILYHILRVILPQSKLIINRYDHYVTIKFEESSQVVDKQIPVIAKNKIAELSNIILAAQSEIQKNMKIIEDATKEIKLNSDL